MPIVRSNRQGRSQRSPNLIERVVEERDVASGLVSRENDAFPAPVHLQCFKEKINTNDSVKDYAGWGLQDDEDEASDFERRDAAQQEIDCEIAAVIVNHRPQSRVAIEFVVKHQVGEKSP